MPYVTEAYYKDTFKGESVLPADFHSLCMRAEEIIEEMTMHRVSSTTFSSFPGDVQERIKKAVCAQIEYLDANGGSDMDNGADLQSASLGKFNYTKSAGTNGSTKQSIYSPRAQRLLLPTGLMYRGGY